MKTKTLLSVGADSKTIKGEKLFYLTGILYLAPARVAGGINVCPHASAACLLACLYTAGRGSFNSVQLARINRTIMMQKNKSEFFSILAKDIERLIKKAKKKNFTPVVRLNGTSDIAWEKTPILKQFSSIQFYDYTKNPQRMEKFLQGKMPANYHLTFSRSESNGKESIDILLAGGSVAVVFANGLPPIWKGFPVIDGDVSDLRFLDPRGVVVGLKAKGAARKDTSGFVVENDW